MELGAGSISILMVGRQAGNSPTSKYVVFRILTLVSYSTHDINNLFVCINHFGVGTVKFTMFMLSFFNTTERNPKVLDYCNACRFGCKMC